jgi:thiamine biosynthesis lipoprotein ApbE
VLREGHHLIDAKSKKSQNDKLIVYVTHNLAVFADIFATALYVTPIKVSLDILASIP